MQGSAVPYSLAFSLNFAVKKVDEIESKRRFHYEKRKIQKYLPHIAQSIYQN